MASKVRPLPAATHRTLPPPCPCTTRLSDLISPQYTYEPVLQTVGPLPPAKPPNEQCRDAGRVQYAVGAKQDGKEFVLVSQWGYHDLWSKTDQGDPEYKSTSTTEARMMFVPAGYDHHFFHFASEFCGIYRFDDRALSQDGAGNFLKLPGAGRTLCGSEGLYADTNAANGRDGPGLIRGRARFIQSLINCDEKGRTVLSGFPLARRYEGGSWQVTPKPGESVSANGWCTNASFLADALLDDEKVAKLPHTVPAVRGEAGPAARRWELMVASQLKQCDAPEQSENAVHHS